MRIKKTNPLTPQQRYVYAVQTGDYAGEMLAYINTDVLYHNFLALPVIENRKIPKKQFTIGMNSSIIEFVEKMPVEVFRVVEAQYKKNENSNHRRQQPDSSHLLDCEEPIEKD